MIPPFRHSAVPSFRLLGSPLKLKIIKLRNISFSNMDFEILKAAMLASKFTMLKGDDVTTEKMPGKMSSGGGNNAKANEWNFYE